MVGGYFGFKMQNIHSEFKINSSSFAPGDNIEVSLACNNGMSRHSVDCFKFKICRLITYQVCGKKVQTAEYLSYEKIPGVKKFE